MRFPKVLLLLLIPAVGLAGESTDALADGVDFGNPRSPAWNIVLDGVLLNDRVLTFDCLSENPVHVYGHFDLQWLQRTTPSGVVLNKVSYVLLPDYYLEVDGKRFYVTDNLMRDVRVVGPIDRDHWAEILWARAEDGEEIFVQYTRWVIRENGMVVTRLSNGACPLGLPKPDGRPITWAAAKQLYR